MKTLVGVLLFLPAVVLIDSHVVELHDRPVARSNSASLHAEMVPCQMAWIGPEESSRILVQGVTCTFFIGVCTHAGNFEGGMKTKLCDGMCGTDGFWGTFFGTLLCGSEWHRCFGCFYGMRFFNGISSSGRIHLQLHGSRI